ncbi:sporulation initiation inhibitor protein Soj [Capsulimonas corticalis]|uniref:Sporulation initiation inhibitor protein Soj n=1 Tax=Capsulimonas corticalis TaxID=2219043 RepID=A0A402D469_9BACT|nr:ParA family protein [Capsulimonas corticalis]BDI29218.1 sporulation initiation inhibitor protein Soj [Capsulimonas corticalis]
MNKETKVYAVVNQKGGVGKTTTAVNLSASLAHLGKRVLLVDCDPQGNATTGLGIDKSALEMSMFDVLVDNVPVAQIVQKDVTVPGLDVAPATLDLSGAEMEMFSQLSREGTLRRSLKPILGLYDYVFIDGPPSLGLLTLNILTCADAVLIPIQCEFYALEGISQLMTIVERVQAHLNPKLSIGLVVLTMHDERINVSRQVVSEVREYFGDVVAETIVPRNVRLSEAPSFGQPISLYDPRSKGAQAYTDLAQEVVSIGKK